MTLIAVLQTIGIITAVAGFIRWIVSFYFRKSTELEKLKADNASTAQKNLQEEVKSVKASVESFKHEIQDFKLRLTENAGQLNTNTKLFESFQKQWEKTAEHLEDRYNALDGAEVIKAGENTFIFKSRKK